MKELYELRYETPHTIDPCVYVQHGVDNSWPKEYRRLCQFDWGGVGREKVVVGFSPRLKHVLVVPIDNPFPPATIVNIIPSLSDNPPAPPAMAVVHPLTHPRNHPQKRGGWVGG